MKFGDLVKVVKNENKTTREEDWYVGREFVLISGNCVVDLDTIGLSTPSLYYLSDPFEYELVKDGGWVFFDQYELNAIRDQSRNQSRNQSRVSSKNVGEECGVYISEKTIQYLKELKSIFADK